MKCFALIFIAVFVLGQSHGGVIDAAKPVLVASDNTKDQLKAAPVFSLVNSAGANRDKRQLFGLPLFGLGGASQSQASASAQAGSGSGSGSGSAASSNSKVSSIGAGIAGINLLHLSSSSSNAQSYSHQ